MCRAFVLLLSLAALGLHALPADAQEDLRQAIEMNSAEQPTSIARPQFSRNDLARRRVVMPRQSGSKWGASLEATFFRQFNTDVDGGSSFAADRIISRLKVSYRVKPKVPLQLSFGYRMDWYDFDGGGSAAFPGRPWERIHSPRVTLPFFAPLGQRWFVIGGLVLRSTVEEGARLEDGITWGGFAGASYKVNDRLSIGPGFGWLTEIEDADSIFPVLVIDWKITRNLTLRTGQGVGSTQGPGLFLDWKVNSRWMISAGGRSERLRFRLDDEGVAPGGVGQDSSFAAVIFADYRVREKFRLYLSAGTNFEGTLTLDDKDGVELFRKGYDPAFMLGFGFNWTF